MWSCMIRIGHKGPCYFGAAFTTLGFLLVASLRLIIQCQVQCCICYSGNLMVVISISVSFHVGHLPTKL